MYSIAIYALVGLELQLSISMFQVHLNKSYVTRVLYFVTFLLIVRKQDTMLQSCLVTSKFMYSSVLSNLCPYAVHCLITIELYECAGAISI